MAETRRKFDADFKKAREPGINEGTLGNWGVPRTRGGRLELRRLIRGAVRKIVRYPRSRISRNSDAACGFRECGARPDPVRGCPCDGPPGSLRPRTYSGQRRRGETDPVVFVQVMAMWRGAEERSVKPSASPTLVRTQDLPPPAKTAHWLRKRGPAGRFLLVTMCISMCHRGSMHSSGYGHIADRVRAKLAVRITARFADPRPFCPVTRAPDCSSDWYMPCIRPDVLRRPARARRRGRSCSYPAAGAGCRMGPRHPIEAATQVVTGCASPAAGWNTGTLPWRATLHAGL